MVVMFDYSMQQARASYVSTLAASRLETHILHNGRIRI